MSHFYSKLNSLIQNSKKLNTCFKPVFFRLQNANDRVEFENLLQQPDLVIIDEIQSQLEELLKYKNPTKKIASAELKSLVTNHLNGVKSEDYGVWVYYPWSKRLVHILDEHEFVSLRTSRNQYKITPEEKSILEQKKIGVIGLSVGQSVSVTLAMERICGELRLADFDILELTNLNRIRTGVHNLGLPKVYSVAREIAEIDPFLKVTCFKDGLTEHNMDEFFTSGGKLDLLVEESDGFDIKLMCRYKARELKVPVIMEASDRCMVDVERFDLEPNRSILHGMVDHLDLEKLKSLKTTEEKIPYMLDILGIETASMRLKASMLEIEQSITTWPQLASAVTMGGGITADVSRRLLLNQYTDSGRYHIDIEELIKNQSQSNVPFNEKLTLNKSPGRTSFVSKAIHQTNDKQLELNEIQLQQIVSAACKAPSGGNAQPWNWVYKDKTLFLFNSFNSNSNFLGFNNYASLVAHGAASENVILKSIELNLDAKLISFPNKQIPELIAAFEFYPLKNNNQNFDARIKAIDLRLTNRLISNRTELNLSALDAIKSIAHEVPEAKLTLFTNPEELEAIGNLLGELEKIRILDAWGHKDFVSEVRWTKEEAEETANGVDIRTLDLSNTEKVGLHISRNSVLIKMLQEWNGGNAFKKLTKKSIDAASALGIITMPDAGPLAFFNGGRLLQKIWLQANAMGIALQPVSASVFVYSRLINDQGKGLDAATILNLSKLRPQFENTFSIAPNHSEIFIFRLCVANTPEIKSLRLGLNQVLEIA